MAKTATKFSQGARVKLKSRKGIHIVTHPMVIPVPSIVNEQFLLVDRIMYKFITATETYYAWEEDVRQ